MPKEPGLAFAEWYHGLLPRKDIDILLTRNGQFLGPQEVLSVRWNDATKHFIIRHVDGKVSIEKHKFASICELIRYHMITKDPITDQSGAILLYVASRQSWEIRHEQIEVNELLGEGAVSAVYKGILKDIESAKEVAVKVRKGRRLNRELIEEICREARIMRRLEHPNVVHLYGIAISKEPIMLLMEFMKDGSLDVFLATKGSALSKRRKLYFCLDIASGLEFLHKNGVIHRDISARSKKFTLVVNDHLMKLEDERNCLVEDLCVKISDFKLSREIGKEDENYELTEFKQNLPIRWLAPETIRNAVYTSKSDVFSYGVLMWEIFTNGVEPYCGMTIAEVIFNVKSGYRMPSPDAMPKPLQVVQQNCFTTEVSERWSIAQIRKEIEMLCLQYQN
uniref:Tyrosine-protein kinase n=1 Tax=Setaria digitata TaxID=48799 RepID=A0A915PHW0_9BILA